MQEIVGLRGARRPSPPSFTRPIFDGLHQLPRVTVVGHVLADWKFETRLDRSRGHVGSCLSRMPSALAGGRVSIMTYCWPKARSAVSGVDRRLARHVHGLIWCTRNALITLTLIDDNSINIEALELALTELRLYINKTISKVAKQFNVSRSTLSRRYRGVTKSTEEQY